MLAADTCIVSVTVSNGTAVGYSSADTCQQLADEVSKLGNQRQVLSRHGGHPRALGGMCLLQCCGGAALGAHWHARSLRVDLLPLVPHPS